MEKDKKEKAIVEPKNIKDVGKNVLDRFRMEIFFKKAH